MVGRVRTCSQISGHVTMYVPTVGLQFLVNAIVNQAIVESAALEVITVVLIDDCLTQVTTDLVILPSYFFFS